jgi:hypothetical protein
VRFIARGDQRDRYRISADGKSCTTPCTLELPALATRVQADSGERSYRGDVEVPYTPSTFAVSHRSRAHYAVGGALLAVGATGIALGFWYALANTFDGHEATGGVTIGLGAGAAVVGILDLALAGRARFELQPSEAGGARVSAR